MSQGIGINSASVTCEWQGGVAPVKEVQREKVFASFASLKINSNSVQAVIKNLRKVQNGHNSFHQIASLLFTQTLS